MAKRIRYLRRRANLKPAELARKLGIHPAAVMRWEQGKATPDNPEAVAAALGLSLAEFHVATIPDDDAASSEAEG
jgi:DNA-binding transcriptional regulator YiaG